MSEYDTIVQNCAIQGRSLMQMMANDGTAEALYLYARRSTPGTGSGQLFLVRQSAPTPPDVELVTGEGLRSSVPYSEYFTWVYDRARRSPILSY